MSARPTTTVRTSYVSPTDTAGAFIRVTEAGTRRQRTYPYDYGARDVHEYAAGRFAREICGMSEPAIEYADGRQPHRGYRFAITETV
jgi:hypothetical protein